MTDDLVVKIENTLMAESVSGNFRRPVSPDDSLGIRYPVIAAQWHPNKNGPITPSDVMPGSDRRAWWQCAEGHEWEASIYNRTRGGGCCPSCKGLVVRYPKLAAQWHPIKNGLVTPYNVTAGSGMRVWWRCPHGHEWQVSISNRTINGRNCPYCAGRYATNDRNLAVSNPKLAAEWHPTKNGALQSQHVTPGSNKKVWWRCSIGHEWCVKISHRAYGSGCPYCSGHKASPEYNLATENPELASEWHPTKNGLLRPQDVTPNATQKVWWRCSAGHECVTTVNYRHSKRMACQVCTNKRPHAAYNLVTVKPDIVAQWHPTKNGELCPDQVLPNSDRKAWWLCWQGHEWEAVIGARFRGTGCPLCTQASSALELRLYCELSALFADVVHRTKIDGVEFDIYSSEHQFAIEVDGLYWHRNSEHRDREKYGLAAQYGVKLFRLREVGLPLLATEDITFRPRENHFAILKRVVKVLSEQLLLPHAAHQGLRMYAEEGRFLANYQYLELLRSLPRPLLDKSLAAGVPDIAAQWHPTKNGSVSPSDVYRNSNRIVWWQCAKGHEWQAVIANRVKGSGCFLCSYPRRR